MGSNKEEVMTERPGPVPAKASPEASPKDHQKQRPSLSLLLVSFEKIWFIMKNMDP